MKFKLKSNDNLYRQTYTSEKNHIARLRELGFEFAQYKESKYFLEITNIPEIEFDMESLIEFTKEFSPVLIDGNTLYIDNQKD
jgi:hypothetical protein